MGTLRDPVHFVAFGFGAGLAPKAPGTFGSLVGVLAAYGLLELPLGARVAVVLAATGTRNDHGIWVLGGGVPFAFVLFVLVLLGVAFFHHHTLWVALAGALVISAYTGALVPGFDWSPEQPTKGLWGHFLHEGDKWIYQDKGSTNGTIVDGKRLKPEEKVPLNDGSRFRLGLELTATFLLPASLHTRAKGT